MGTRSIIAAEFDTPEGVEVKGVYAHWDGYPEHMLVALKEIVARDGRDAAVKELFAEGGQGWSSIRPSQDETPTRDSKRYRAVLGYGDRYLDEPDEPFMTRSDAEEYFYIIRLDGTVVWTEDNGNSGPWFGDVDGTTKYAEYTDVPASGSHPLAEAVVVDEDTETDVIAAVRDVLAEAGVPDDKMGATIVRLFVKLSNPAALGTVV